jgi:hypothetical protein
MYAARPRGCDADTYLAGILRIADGGKCRCLLVPYLNKVKLVLMRPQGFEEAIHAIAGKPKIVSMPQVISRSTIRSDTC